MNFIVRAMRKIVAKIGDEGKLEKFDANQAVFEAKLIVSLSDALEEALAVEESIEDANDQAITLTAYEQECVEEVLLSSKDIEMSSLFVSKEIDTDTEEAISLVNMSLNKELKFLNSKKSKSSVVRDNIFLLRACLTTLKIANDKKLAIELVMVALQSKVSN